MIQVGHKAYDFALRDQNKKLVRLSSYKGKKVLLSFRPLAWTPLCHDQMISLENSYQRFEELNAVAFGIGVDSVPSNKAWADVMEIEKTELLSDFWPHGAIAQTYGVFRDKDGFSERANIVIDEEQKVIFAKIYPLNKLPNIEEVLEFLETHKTR